jgi:hypothetical protein
MSCKRQCRLETRVSKSHGLRRCRDGEAGLRTNERRREWGLMTKAVSQDIYGSTGLNTPISKIIISRRCRDGETNLQANSWRLGHDIINKEYSDNPY